MKTERIDKLFSRLGICSRKETLDLIRWRKIINGEVPVKSVHEKVNPLEITFNDKALGHSGRIAIILYKPEDVICSRLGDNTIFQFLPESWSIRRPLVNSVGRLDKDTTGILIITDDGDLSHKIISPRHHIPKIYEIEVESPFSGNEPGFFKSGMIKLPGEAKPCKPADFEIISHTTGRLKLYEGKYQQIKRMFYEINNHVVKLHRSIIGALGLGELLPGEWRDLTEEDFQLLGLY